MSRPDSNFPVDDAYVIDTLRALVQINSINPSFTDGRTNETEIAAWVVEELERLGLAVTRVEPEPGRPSVVGRPPGRTGGPSILLYAHLDTVGVDGMTDPFDATIHEGRLHGRGAYDMKSGLAACLGAVRALVEAGHALPGEVLLAAVADEEVASLGMTSVLETIVPDAAIVTEPTDLRVCVAHKGFSWIQVETFGRAAHGSRFEEGVDANLRMGRFLGRLERLETELRGRQAHPLLGSPSLHAGVLRGGTAPSVYAERCRVEIERRTLPEETEETVVAELQALVDELVREDSDYRAAVTPLLARTGFENRPDAPVVRAVREAASGVLGREPPIIGESYWMDAALLAARGVDTVAFGASGAGAHAAGEWVELETVVQLGRILAGAAVRYLEARAG